MVILKKECEIKRRARRCYLDLSMVMYASLIEPGK